MPLRSRPLRRLAAPALLAALAALGPAPGALAAAATVAPGVLAAAAPAGEVAILANGQRVAFPDARPVIEGDRVLVPLRALAEALGAQVEWDGATQTVTLTLGQRRVRLTVGAPVAYVGLRIVPLEVPAVLRQNRVLVPLRFVAEGLGARVEWDSSNRTVRITYRTFRQDPAAMALLQRLQAPANTDYRGTMAMRLDLAPGAAVAVQASFAGALRDGAFVQTLRLTANTLPQPVEVQQAYRQGRLWTRTGQGPWQEVQAPAAASPPDQILAALGDPDRYGAELGQRRTTGGRSLQEVVVTPDPDLIQELMDAVAGAAAVTGQVRVEVTGARLVLLVDEATGQVVEQHLDLNGRLSRSQAGLRHEAELEVQMDFQITPAQDPMAWPADLP